MQRRELQTSSASAASQFKTIDELQCNTVENFPVFYGGILNTIVRGVNVSPD
jgi:hypothetical protein